jgi:hypothetical protein
MGHITVSTGPKTEIHIYSSKKTHRGTHDKKKQQFLSSATQSLQPRFGSPVGTHNPGEKMPQHPVELGHQLQLVSWNVQAPMLPQIFGCRQAIAAGVSQDALVQHADAL